MDLYNGFNGLRHRINWTYFTVLDGLAHPLYSVLDNFTLQGTIRHIAMAIIPILIHTILIQSYLVTLFTSHAKQSIGMMYLKVTIHVSVKAYFSK